MSIQENNQNQGEKIRKTSSVNLFGFTANAELKLILTHSFPMHLFSSPWKYQETLRFSDVFGADKGCIGSEWVKHTYIFKAKDVSLPMSKKIWFPLDTLNFVNYLYFQGRIFSLKQLRRKINPLNRTNRVVFGVMDLWMSLL